MYASRVNASATLPGKEASLVGPRGAEIHRDKDDGLAAILAAKIRTKAELKQVLFAIIVECIIVIADNLTIFLFLFRSESGSLQRKHLLKIYRLRRKVIIG